MSNTEAKLSEKWHVFSVALCERSLTNAPVLCQVIHIKTRRLLSNWVLQQLIPPVYHHARGSFCQEQVVQAHFGWRTVKWQQSYPPAVPEFEASQPKSTHPAERDCTRSSKQTLRVYLDKGRVSEQKQQVTRQGAVPAMGAERVSKICLKNNWLKSRLLLAFYILQNLQQESRKLSELLFHIARNSVWRQESLHGGFMGEQSRPSIFSWQWYMLYSVFFFPLPLCLPSFISAVGFT